jgi:hypothetical protein
MKISLDPFSVVSTFIFLRAEADESHKNLFFAQGRFQPV